MAGGCVRDRLLHRPPKDHDVATAATPTQVQKIFKRTIPVGKSFGVIRVLIDGNDIEVATFRTEGPYRDGRRPSSVTFTSAREDALRRDFTINGLFLDPLSKKVIDHVDGKKDLKNRILRAIGNPQKRFSEDHLRLLRCIRFSAQLGFSIHPGTWKAVKSLSSRIRRVSAERVREELSLLITAPHSQKGLLLLHRSGLMKHLLPEVEAARGVRQPRAYHPEGDVFKHTLAVVGCLKKPSRQLAWAALLHDVGKPPTFEKSMARGRLRLRFPDHAHVGGKIADKILRRLRFSNEDREAIVSMVAHHMTFKDVQAMRTSTLKRLLARSTFPEELQLHRADCGASNRKMDNFHFLLKKQRAFSREEIRPPRLLTGHDLIQIGLKPGPQFGEILHAIEEQQLDGNIQTREEAIAFVRKHSARA